MRRQAWFINLFIDGGAADASSDGGSKMRLSPIGRILLVYGHGYSTDARAPRSTDIRNDLSFNLNEETGELSFTKN